MDGSQLIEKAFSINHKKIAISFKKGELLGIFPDGGVSYNLLSKPKKGQFFYPISVKLLSFLWQYMEQREHGREP